MKFIEFERKQQHIGWITLNRPDAMNAMSLAMLDELNELLDDIHQGIVDIRILIITGAGKRAFSAGADLKERRAMDDIETLRTVQYIGDTMDKIDRLPVPVIAAINGPAIGGGLELALACDIRIAAADVKVGLTETSLAIIPGAGGTQRLSRLIGTGQAKRLIFSASLVHAAEAFELGIVEKIVNGDVLEETVHDMAQQIIRNGPIALQAAKQAINQGIETDLQTGLVLERLAYERTLGTKDRQEGLKAFREKRSPNYTGE